MRRTSCATILALTGPLHHVCLFGSMRTNVVGFDHGHRAGAHGQWQRALAVQGSVTNATNLLHRLHCTCPEPGLMSMYVHACNMTLFGCVMP